MIALMVVLVSGCYTAPDYGTANFKCDKDHGCPPGQGCVNARCVLGGAPAISVECAGVTCDAGHACCVDIRGSVTCIAAGASCEGEAATCDGVEDCNGGACCLAQFGGQVACGDALCSDQVCRENADCLLASAPMCCLGIGPPGEPWGHCEPSCS